MSFFVIKRLLWETVTGPFETALWWYTKGLAGISHWYRYVIVRGNARLGVLLWIKNIFVPMYGQRDWQGRAVSIGMRIAQIIARGFVFVLLVLGTTLLLLLWVVAPILIIMGLVSSLLGL